MLLHYRAGGLLQYRAFYYIIGQLLHYRAFFITLSGSNYSIGRYYIIGWYTINSSHLATSLHNRPYSRRGHDRQKERLCLQIYRKFARQYVNCDVTSLLLNVLVT